MDRRTFFSTVAAAAVVAATPVSGPPTHRIVEACGEDGVWHRCYMGLLDVKAGQRFRTLDPVTGALYVEATADEDGQPCTDDNGLRCGCLHFDCRGAVGPEASVKP